MFQCLGLASESDGGCGEDWWHPECVVGLGRQWAKKIRDDPKEQRDEVKEEGKEIPETGEEAQEEHPLPPHFPHEDKFETFICYKCVNATPWIKRYAGSKGFLPPVYHTELEKQESPLPETGEDAERYISNLENISVAI